MDNQKVFSMSFSKIYPLYIPEGGKEKPDKRGSG